MIWQEIYHHPSVFVQELAGILLSPLRRRRSVQIEVTVLLRNRAAAEDAGVVEKLKRLGLQIEQILPRLSVVSGKIHRSEMARLQSLPEVKAVREAGSYHVDPVEG
ncbi:hypothetical protein CVM73_03545 [Bradyrhizobium forestalis]|uniref:Uncharacterized protein n=1 Tax=Bradyrhizobium forestalis TaxID=1419263 RepID=A0A2M8RFP4_9BRAD|nr:hypothetical protein [Bradyrhizobium forestalis]PJG56634.1 hypothetical protein CVM73_03545 [Bradyrhizobium forestalis]